MYQTPKELISRAYLDANYILKYVSEKEIFSLVFGYLPEEYEYVKSPFRKDSSPGCWFQEASNSGRIKFVDFNSTLIVRGKKFTSMDCFDAVCLKYNLSFKDSLHFIYKHLIRKDSQASSVPKLQKREIIKPKNNIEIFERRRNFNATDKKFWSEFHISKQNLIDDAVHPITGFVSVNSTKNKVVDIHANGISYAINVDNKKKKIYTPQNKEFKFYTNCSNDDLGGLADLPLFGDLILYTKSYKDWRVLKNQGLNVVWTQSESMFPSEELIKKYFRGYKRHLVFFDNDSAGISGANIFKTLLAQYLPGVNISSLQLPEELLTSRGITDPSDFIKSFGPNGLKSFLYQNQVL